MRKDTVEIYSDATNAAVIRHPGRKFPGVLIQGDNLHHLCEQADRIARGMTREAPEYDEINDLRNHLWSYLTHYKSTLTEHDIEMPFSEQQTL